MAKITATRYERRMEKAEVVYKGVVKRLHGQIQVVHRKKAVLEPAHDTFTKLCRGCNTTLVFARGQIANYHNKCRTQARKDFHASKKSMVVQEGVTQITGPDLGQTQEGKEPSVSLA